MVFFVVLEQFLGVTGVKLAKLRRLEFAILCFLIMMRFLTFNHGNVFDLISRCCSNNFWNVSSTLSFLKSCYRPLQCCGL